MSIQGPPEDEVESGDEDEHALGMDTPTEAAERAYDRRLTWGWRLVGGGLLTAVSGLGFVRTDTLVNDVFQFALLLVLPVGVVLVGSAMVQFPRQTLGKFGNSNAARDDWGERRHKGVDAVQSEGQGVVRGGLIVLVGLGLAVGAGLLAF